MPLESRSSSGLKPTTTRTSVAQEKDSKVHNAGAYVPIKLKTLYDVSVIIL